MTNTVTLPKKVFDDLAIASEYFGRAQDEMENYLLGTNKIFLARVKKARGEHIQKRFGNWNQLKNLYGLPR